MTKLKRIFLVYFKTIKFFVEKKEDNLIQTKK